MWILSCTASVGYLSRMTQWKSKIAVADSRTRITPMTSQVAYDPLLAHAQEYTADVNVAFLSWQGNIEKTDFREETWSWAAGF